MVKVIPNEKTGANEAHIEGHIVSISDNVQENANGTKFQLAEVAVEYPDGTKDTANASVWSKNVDSGLIKPDMRCTVAIQIDGDYAGYAKVNLPAAKQFSVAKLGLKDVAKPVEADA